jgi:transcriptional regulator with XRE-family HTH domain
MDERFTKLKGALAGNIRALRLARGWSQELLSFEADIDRTYVSQLERGVINPSLLVLHKVACALHTDAVSLLMEAAPLDSATCMK